MANFSIKFRGLSSQKKEPMQIVFLPYLIELMSCEHQNFIIKEAQAFGPSNQLIWVYSLFNSHFGLKTPIIRDLHYRGRFSISHFE